MRKDKVVEVKEYWYHWIHADVKCQSSPQKDEERIEKTRGVNASSQGLNKNTRFANFTVGGENATLNSSEVQQFPLKSNGENVTLVTEIGNFPDNRVVKDVDFAANATVSSSGESNVTSVNNNNSNNNNNDNVTVVIDAGGSSSQDVKMEGRFSLNDQNCDIYDGMWIRDDSKPYYPLGSCPLIDRDFDCHLNGRPDSDYVKWKWQPHKCDISREDYYQEGNHVYPRLKVLDAFRRALTTWARWVDKNIDANQTQVVFRGYSTTHFRLYGVN
ncbi:Protein trichome birefringence-like [Arachis hypogaea]|nr:Protein trichome birefringence-like [Arachis hypogaea]